MNQIKVGNKVRVVDNGQTYTTYKEWAVANGLTKYQDGKGVVPDGSEGEVLAVAPHMSRHDHSVLAGVHIDGQSYIIGVTGLEVIPQPNGVDGDGNPVEFTVADLKPFQRVVFKDGTVGVVGYEVEGHGLCISIPALSSFIGAFFDHSCRYHIPYIITEVYAPPHVNRAMTATERGELVFSRKDFAAERAAKLAEADKAIAEAEAQLAAARAAKAAI